MASEAITVTAASGGLALIGDAGVIALDPVGLSALRNYAPPPMNPTPEQQAANQRALDLIDTLAESLQEHGQCRPTARTASRRRAGTPR